MRPRVWNLTLWIFGQNEGHHRSLCLGMAAHQIDSGAEASIAELQIEDYPYHQRYVTKLRSSILRINFQPFNLIAIFRDISHVPGLFRWVMGVR